jgi:hypothetical protein
VGQHQQHSWLSRCFTVKRLGSSGTAVSLPEACTSMVLANRQPMHCTLLTKHVCCFQAPTPTRHGAARTWCRALTAECTAVPHSLSASCWL